MPTNAPKSKKSQPKPNLPRVEVLPLEQAATPDPQNVNKHTVKGSKLLENSLRKHGAFRSIASAGKNVKVPVTYAGSNTLETAAAAGFKEIINVHVRGDQLVNVVRDDLEPGSAEAIALGIEDNETAKQSYNPDIDVLAKLRSADNGLQGRLAAKDEILSTMLDEMGGRRDFNPNLTPMFSTAKVVDGDVLKEKAALDDRFKENDEYLEVICPECAHVFYINKKDIK
jgi:hypothetical protein